MILIFLIIPICRQVYRQFIDEMIVQPGFKKYESARTDVTYEDHVS